MDELTMAGLVGVTLVVSVGGLFDDSREWLLGFSVPLNPLRIFGTVLSSTLIIGFGVGAVYASRKGLDVVTTGGLVALVSAVADEALALMHGIVRRVMPTRMPIPQMMQPPEQTETGIETDEGRVPTEDDVHAKMDKEEAEEMKTL